MFRLEDACRPGFARHETFHPRFGWFRKSVEACGRSQDAFLRESATVDLGVGKNMVRAIRFWGRAAKVITDVPNPNGSRVHLTAPTHRGDSLLDDATGLDPYLELPGSVWLLHWWMLSSTCLLPAWWLAFNRFGPIEFSAEDLTGFVDDEVRRAPGWDVPALASLKKDVDCLLRMYAPNVTGRFALDDLLDCPFRELGVVEPVWDDRKRFRFMLGPKPTLPPAVLMYAALDYLARTDPNARTSTLSRLTQGIGGPGRVFKLTDDALEVGLRAFADAQPSVGVRIISAVGVPQLTIDGDPLQAATAALRSYYAGAGQIIKAPIRLDEDSVIGLSRLFEETASSPAEADAPVLLRAGGRA